MPIPNASFDTLASTTLRLYSPNMVENIMGQNALLWKLQERGFRGVEQGGTSITHPILHGESTAVGSFSYYDLLDVTPQDGITTAELDWKHLYATITISEDEEFRNSGDRARIVNLLAAKTKQAEMSLKLDMNRQLYADGSGNASKEITGLALAVEDGAAWSTYAGIDSSLWSFWRNQWVDAASANFTTASGTSTVGLVRMRNLFNKCVRGNSKPDLIITTQAIYESYETTVEEKLRLTSTKLADAGFVNQTFKGVPMVFDEDCPANTIFFLNSEFIKLVVGKGRSFVTSDFAKPHNQAAKVAKIYWTGNLITYKRDQQGRLGNIVGA